MANSFDALNRLWEYLEDIMTLNMSERPVGRGFIGCVTIGDVKLAV